MRNRPHTIRRVEQQQRGWRGAKLPATPFSAQAEKSHAIFHYPTRPSPDTKHSRSSTTDDEAPDSTETAARAPGPAATARRPTAQRTPPQHGPALHSCAPKPSANPQDPTSNPSKRNTGQTTPSLSKNPHPRTRLNRHQQPTSQKQPTNQHQPASQPAKPNARLETQPPTKPNEPGPPTSPRSEAPSLATPLCQGIFPALTKRGGQWRQSRERGEVTRRTQQPDQPNSTHDPRPTTHDPRASRIKAVAKTANGGPNWNKITPGQPSAAGGGSLRPAVRRSGTGGRQSAASNRRLAIGALGLASALRGWDQRSLQRNDPALSALNTADTADTSNTVKIAGQDRTTRPADQRATRAVPRPHCPPVPCRR